MKIHSKIITLLLTAIVLFAHNANAQEWAKMMEDGETNFYEVQEAFNQAWEGKEYEKGNGWKQFKRWEAFMEPRVYPTGERMDPSITWTESKKAKRLYGNSGVSKSASWTPLGPFDWTSDSYNPGLGRVNVVFVDPNNSSTIYAGVPAGGLWKSTDNGSSWTPLIQDQPTLGVSGIAVDHNNSNIVYIGTGDGDGADTYSNGVLKSTDGGATWSSTGLSWNTTQSRTTRKLLMHPTNNNVLFLAANNGLFKTTDGAATWTMVQEGSMRDVEFKPSDPSIVYACSNEFFRSTDGGDTFTQITNGLPNESEVNRMSIAVSPDEPNWVYGLYGDDSNSSYYGLYRSTDSGLDFSQRSNSPNIFTYSETGSGSGGQSWYDMALAIDPNDANDVYAGGINVWKSTNGGTNWTIVSHWTWPSTIGYTHADIHTLDFYGSTLYCGSDGGLFRSTNFANTWNDITAGMQIMQFYRIGGTPQNADLVIGGAQDNGCNLMDGSTWLHVFGADGMESAIDPTNESTMYCSSQSGGIRRSYNGGYDWNGITNGIGGNGAWVTPYLLDPNNSNTIYVGYNNIWKSTNQGNDWTQLSTVNTNRTVRALAVSEFDSDYIVWANSNSIRFTANGGNSWSNIVAGTPDLSCTYLAFHPQDPNIIYATFSGFNLGEKVFITTDAGNTWTNISGNLPNLPVNCIVYENGSQGGIYVGTDIGVWYSDSTLSNWQPFSQGMPNVIVNELEIHYPTSSLRAATYGRGLWESPLYTPSAVPPVAQFIYGNTTICPGDFIQFFDASMDAAPGWDWQFPGGTPSSSTQQNPWVSFSATGTYTVTLNMSNANGNDGQTQQVDVVIADNVMELAIVVDDYPQETTWIVENDQGELVGSGGPYGGLSSGTQVEEQFCLPDGCYTFTIIDSYGDGICCGFGNGSYNLYTFELGTIVSGGNFGDSEATDFCVGITTTIEEIQNDVQLLIVPNPNGGSFSLQGNGLQDGPANMRVFDAIGREIFNSTFTVSGGTMDQAIDLSDMTRGIYLIKIQMGGQSEELRLLVE